MYIFKAVWGMQGFIWAGPFANIFTTLVSVGMFFFMRKQFPKSDDEEIVSSEGFVAAINSTEDITSETL
jgi:hypothetical protein